MENSYKSTHFPGGIFNQSCTPPYVKFLALKTRQKNLKMFEELIKKHSNENDIILDTFLGSGTTAIACKNTKRKFKGCEISKEYFDKIKELII